MPRGLDALPLEAVLPLLAAAGYEPYGPPHMPRIACPFHDDTTPSCQLYQAPWAHFYCYGCGRHGNFVILLARALYPDAHPGWAWVWAWERLTAGGLPFVPGARRPREPRPDLDAGERGALGTALAFFRDALWGADAAGRAYLAARFPKDLPALERVLRADGVGFATPAAYRAAREALAGYPDAEAWLVRTGIARVDARDGLVPRLSQRVVLGEARSGAGTVFYQARDVRPVAVPPAHPRAPYLSPPLPKHALGLGHALRHPALPVLLVEGPMDQLAGRIAGYAAVATLGATPPPELAAALRGRDVVDALDGDAGGATIRAKLGPILEGARSVRRAPIPAGLDPAALVQRGGALALQRLVE